MPRENSFSDEGRSITPELDQDELVASPPPMSPKDEKAAPPTQPTSPRSKVPGSTAKSTSASVNVKSPTSPTSRQPLGQSTSFHGTPTDRFRSVVRKVMHMHRSASYIQGVVGVGAEPGVDPRRDSATRAYGHIREECMIEIMDYSSVRHSFGRMTNKEFIELLADPKASQPERWVKVRWINVGGISWCVYCRPVGVNKTHRPQGCDIRFGHQIWYVLCMEITRTHPITKCAQTSIHWPLRMFFLLSTGLAPSQTISQSTCSSKFNATRSSLTTTRTMLNSLYTPY